MFDNHMDFNTIQLLSNNALGQLPATRHIRLDFHSNWLRHTGLHFRLRPPPQFDGHEEGLFMGFWLGICFVCPFDFVCSCLSWLRSFLAWLLHPILQTGGICCLSLRLLDHNTSVSSSVSRPCFGHLFCLLVRSGPARTSHSWPQPSLDIAHCARTLLHSRHARLPLAGLR